MMKGTMPNMMIDPAKMRDSLRKYSAPGKGKRSLMDPSIIGVDIYKRVDRAILDYGQYGRSIFGGFLLLVVAFAYIMVPRFSHFFDGDCNVVYAPAYSCAYQAFSPPSPRLSTCVDYGVVETKYGGQIGGNLFQVSFLLGWVLLGSLL
jgi:hypothetical protein